MAEQTGGDRAVEAFFAECEAKSSIELEHFLTQKYLKSTWKLAGRRMLDRKRVEDAVERHKVEENRAHRNTLAAESQAASARSANRRATVALIFSVIAIIVTAIQAIPVLLSLLRPLI